MAALTWRNVDAPDFRGSLEGFRTAGQLLKNAATGWNDQLAADSALATEAQQRDIRGEGLNQTQYINQRLRGDNANLDAAAPALRALATGSFSNDREAVADAMGNPMLQRLGAPQYMDALSGNQNLMSKALGQDSVRMSQDVVEYSFDRTKRTDGYADQVAMVMPDIMRKSANQADLLKNSEAAMAELSPEARGPFMRAVNAYAPGTYSLGAISGTTEDAKPDASFSGSVTGKPTPQTVPVGNAVNPKGENSFDTVLGYGAFGKPEKPVTQMTLGEGIKFGRDVLIPATRGNKQLGLKEGQGSSAIGAFQFTGETLEDFGPKVLGPDWKSQKLTPENQDKLAQAIFERDKDKNLKNRWSSLPDTTPGAYKNKSWNEMRQIIAQGEGAGNIGDGADLTSMPSAGARRDAAFQIQAKIGNIANTGIAADIEKAQLSTKSLSEVADELISTDVKDWSVKRTMSELQKVMTAGNLTAPMAAAVLRRSLSAPNSDGNTLFSKYLPWVDSQKNVSEDLIKANIAAIGGGGIDRAVSTLGDTKDFAESLTSAEDKAKTARAELQAVQARVDAGQVGLQDSLPALTEKRDKAVIRLNSLLEQQRNSANLNADRAAQKAAKDLLDLQNQAKNKKPAAKFVPPAMTVDRIDQLLANGGD